MNVDGKALDEWNLANVKARQDYRHQQGLSSLPGGLNHRTEGLRGRPIRGWLLDALADLEIAEAKLAIAEIVIKSCKVELVEALLEVKKLERVQEADLLGLRQEDPDDGVPEHGSVFGSM